MVVYNVVICLLQGYLNWTHVPKNVTIKNITVPEDKIYQFAIAANSKTESSGMVWSSCTVIHNKGTLKSVNKHLKKNVFCLL